jgi:hypothetical protein
LFSKNNEIYFKGDHSTKKLIIKKIFRSFAHFLSVIHTFPCFYNKYCILNVFRGPGGTEYFKNNYIVPWCRFSPYICGILLGYVLHITKGKPFKMPKVIASKM